jgi:hypothetical protein
MHLQVQSIMMRDSPLCACECARARASARGTDSPVDCKCSPELSTAQISLLRDAALRIL